MCRAVRSGNRSDKVSLRLHIVLPVILAMLCIPKGFSMDSDRKKDSLDRKGKERELKELPDRQQKKDKEGPGRHTLFSDTTFVIRENS